LNVCVQHSRSVRVCSNFVARGSNGVTPLREQCAYREAAATADEKQ
jgi:hypothetical protein